MRFSVIIPLYNKDAYITKAIESVLTQTYDDFELLVVNDGSTDNSLAVVERMMRDNVRLQSFFRSARFTLINQENSGVSTARNNAVAQSKGDYVCFLDGDDWWDADFLKEMCNLICEYPDAGIYGSNYWYVKYNSQQVCVKKMVTGYVDYVDAYLTQMDSGGGMPLWTCAVAMKRIVFDNMNGFKPHLKLGEDFDLWLRIALRYKVAFLDKPLAFYNQNAVGQSRATKKLHNAETHEVFNYGCFAEEENKNPKLKLLLDKKRVICLFNYYLSKQYRDIAKLELGKVDWSRLPQSDVKLYRTPIWLLKLKQQFMLCGSHVKRLVFYFRDKV